jgi:hypothetical protein
MKLTALGHISFLLEIASERGGAPVRILGDPWLSDYAIGDLMGRFPRLRFDPAAFEPLDAIFLSHSHTDHFDPPSLVRLWDSLRAKPALLLPASILHLRGILEEQLPGVRIVPLHQGSTVDLRGVSIGGFFNPERQGTNEDDVFVLVVRGDKEVFLDESDALLPFYDPELRARLARILCDPGVETAVFLTAKNQLEATMSMLSSGGREDRMRRLSASLELVYEEIREIFEPFVGEDEEDEEGDEDEDDEAEAADDSDFEGDEDEGGDALADVWADPRVIRLVGGQGMCYPQALGTEWNHVLFPVRVDDRVRFEREIAADFGRPTIIEAFTPGSTFTLAAGRIASKARAGFVELLDRESDRSFRPELELRDDFPVAPLREETRDVERQRAILSELLDHRFLPYLIGVRAPAIEQLLSAGGGEYRIRIRYGTTSSFVDRDFRLTFDVLRFVECDAAAAEPDEWYWANDLEDTYDGRSDEFSIFCRRPLPARAQRLWNSLGYPYLNADLIGRKLRLHFERARAGDSIEPWVLSFYPSRT